MQFKNLFRLLISYLIIKRIILSSFLIGRNTYRYYIGNYGYSTYHFKPKILQKSFVFLCRRRQEQAARLMVGDHHSPCTFATSKASGEDHSPPCGPRHQSPQSLDKTRKHKHYHFTYPVLTQYLPGTYPVIPTRYLPGDIYPVRSGPLSNSWSCCVALSPKALLTRVGLTAS